MHDSYDAYGATQNVDVSNKGNSLLKLMDMSDGKVSKNSSKLKGKFLGKQLILSLYVLDYGNSGAFVSSKKSTSGLHFTERAPGGVRSYSQMRPSNTSTLDTSTNNEQ